jgi:beta-galactosidase
MTAVDPLHVLPFGVYAPSHVTSEITATSSTTSTAAAILNCTVDVVNYATSEAKFAVTTTVVDQKSGAVVVTKSSEAMTLAANSNTTYECGGMSIAEATLWSIEDPHLYTLVTEVTNTAGDDGPDVVNTTFGVRKAVFDADKGFFLNDKSVKIKGTCQHQDFAGVGVAVPDVLQEYRVKALKGIGGNGWRTAHNCPTEALLDTTDKLGMVVWDENHRNGQPDEMEILIRRDRNHPSVVIWSLCNGTLAPPHLGSLVL